MRLLLDTHAFLWFVTADPKLTARAERAICDGRNEVLLSLASVWEMAIKVSIGRLPLPQPFDSFIPRQLALNRFELLPIELQHTFAVPKLPLHHRDPFDRMLAVQVQAEGLQFISADPAFDAYGIQRLW